MRVVVAPAASGLPEWARSDRGRRTSSADFLNRRLVEACRARSQRLGSGKGGELRVLQPGQQVLERTSLVVFDDGELEARFKVGLPARGRRVMGRAAAELLTEVVPAAIGDALLAESLELDLLRTHCEAVEDAQALRGQLAGRGLVAFVADGALLPRRSGVDDRPLAEGAVPFVAPDELRVSLEAPNAGELSGLGVPAGVTLIVGGGFHGKSTLLRAIELGVYDHVPGDGRERVVSLPGAVKVRAEDGRAVAGVDIANFIGRLPGGQDTTAFTTPNASGSTSQAASTVEALEVGATCLLIDEDTCATNFMIRDARMQALVPDELEPITPFIDRARELSDARGVSTVIVVGGSGDYFDVADTVIAMQAYRPRAVTSAAKQVAAELPTQRKTGAGPWQAPAARIPLARSIDPRKGKRDRHLKVPAPTRALFGLEEVDLSAVEQLVETAQVRALAEALAWARDELVDGQRTVADVVAEVCHRIEAQGLEAIQRWPAGDLAAFRPFELAAFLNRLRSLRVKR